MKHKLSALCQNNKNNAYKKIKFVFLFTLIILTFLSCSEPPQTFSQAQPQKTSINPVTPPPTSKIEKRNGNRVRIPSLGMHILILGSGGPDGADHERASSGYVIFVNGQAKILMDAGGGSYERLVKTGIDIKNLEIILLTHLHIDHTSDLSAIIKLMYFQNRIAGTVRSVPFHVYGPEMNGIPFPDTDIPQYPSISFYINQHYSKEIGTERYLNIFTKAIGAGEFNYIAHDLPADVTTPIMEIVNENGLVIESIAVNHGPVPAVAFRISYNNKIIVYSGDTTSNTENMITLSQNADLVFYDTAITDTLPGDIISNLHTTPTRMGQVATAANIKTLILTHLTGTTLPRLGEIKHSIRLQNFTGEIEEAEDFEVY